MKRLPEETAPRLLPERSASEVERELAGIRVALDLRLSELNRRRHELTDWRLQLRRHPRIVAGAGIGALVVVGGLVAALLISRRRQRPVSTARQLRLAAERAFRSPQKIARPEPGVALKVLAAIATSAGTMLARRYIEALWRNPPQQAFGRQRHASAAAAEPAHALH